MRVALYGRVSTEVQTCVPGAVSFLSLACIDAKHDQCLPKCGSSAIFALYFNKSWFDHFSTKAQKDKL